jgi:hypothetical protein
VLIVKSNRFENFNMFEELKTGLEQAVAYSVNGDSSGVTVTRHTLTQNRLAVFPSLRRSYGAKRIMRVVGSRRNNKRVQPK